MRYATVFCVFALGGCGLLSLDETTLDSADADHDGVADSHDNCKGTANPDQLDIDQDGIGDACDPLICQPGTGVSINRDVDHDGVDDGCDPCLRGPNEDEDGDGLFDACDDCPIVADPDQKDKDKDDIGDACDLDSSTVQQRVFFDGFGAGDHGWLDGRWTVAAGALGAVAGSATTSINNVVVNTDAAGPHWYVMVGVTLGHQGAVRILFTLGGPAALDCGLFFDPTVSGYRLVGRMDPQPQFQLPLGNVIEGGQHVTLWAHLEPGTGKLACQVLETGDRDVLNFVVAPGALRAELAVDDFGATVTSVDVVR